MSDIDRYKAAVAVVEKWGHWDTCGSVWSLPSQCDCPMASIPILDAMVQRVAELEGERNYALENLHRTQGARDAVGAELEATRAKLATSEERVRALVETLETALRYMPSHHQSDFLLQRRLGNASPDDYDEITDLVTLRAALAAARDGGECPMPPELETERHTR